MSLTPLLQKPVNLGKRIIYRAEKWLYHLELLKTDQLTFPDFLCAGVEKSGTTWLYENLKCHPELNLPDRKELNYFSSKYRFYGLPLSHYSRYFKGVTKIKGEITPCENMPIGRIRFMHKIMPSLKIIIILRNPVERIWSAALMHLVRAKNRNIEDIPESEFLQLFKQRSHYSRGDYPVILNNWRQVFPKHQLHICFYDDLKSDPKRFLESVFDFLAISKEVNWLQFPVDEIINSSHRIEIPNNLRLYLEEKYQESLKELTEEFPQIIDNWNLLLN